MSANTLAIRFTDDNYATKTDVMKSLGTSLVDSIWKNILAYRQQFAHKLGIKTIPQLPFYVTYSQPISTKIATFGVKMTRFMVNYEQLQNSGNLPIKEKFDRYDGYLLLKGVSQIEDVAASELSLRAMLNGTYLGNDPTQRILTAYKGALEALTSDYSSSIDENLLAYIYGELVGESELTTFYRVSDPDSGSMFRTVVIARDYKYAPYSEIPDLMDNLFRFLSDEKIDSVVKVAMCGFFLDYVKPFGKYNVSCGLLLAKYVLSKSLGACASLIPLENVFAPNPRLTQLCLETQRSGDLTYVVLYLIEKLDALMDELSNAMRRFQTETIESERAPISSSDIAPAVEETPVPAPVIEKPVEMKPVEVKPVEMTPVEPAPVVKPETYVAPIPEVVQPKEEPVPEPAPRVEEPKPVVKETPRVELVKPVVAAKPIETIKKVGERAVVIEENLRSDKENKEFARYIIETHPELSKGQATFFSTHSTLGRYYTIQDYKHTIRCAYETARTSMDKLASSGFYQKLQIKNKFVYTPIRQGD